MEKIALNYALMIEMIRMHDVTNEEMISLLNSGNSKSFEKFGEGIPDWQTLIDFYQQNKEKISSVINDNYQITFLTKGALKSLLKFKYRLEEDKDFQDSGQHLYNVNISTDALNSLKLKIAKNWTIIDENKTNGQHTVKIELTHKPIL